MDAKALATERGRINARITELKAERKRLAPVAINGHDQGPEAR